MSTRYPGGFINRSAPVIVGPVDGEGGSAPGVWTLEQASYYTKQGTWPKPNLTKTLFTWGAGSKGQLAQNSTADRSSPVQVGALTNWKQISFSQYGTTQGTLYGIDANGNAFASGINNYYQLGTLSNNPTYVSSPVQVSGGATWSLIAGVGGGGAIAIKTNGSLWSWGLNTYGVLGQQSSGSTTYSSPVQVGALTTWRNADVRSYATLAIKTDGTLWAWGINSFGQLGQGNVIYRSSPVQVGADTTWLSISSGYASSYAIKTDGTLWAWGSNSEGQLGDGTVAPKSSPTQVGNLTTWSGCYSGTYSGMAVKTNGTLWSWGNNGLGQLGQNNTINYSSPVQVGALTNWSNASGGNFFTLAVKTDGTLWAWGFNIFGQLGLGDTNYRSSPVQVGNLTNWWKTTARGYYSAALTRY